MSQYYGWPAYWSMDPPLAPVFVPDHTEPVVGDPHLRSVREILSYQVHATDGELGNLDDVFLEETAWYIRYLVANTGSWLSGQKLLVSTRWVRSIDWSHRQVLLSQTREEL